MQRLDSIWLELAEGSNSDHVRLVATDVSSDEVVFSTAMTLAQLGKLIRGKSVYTSGLTANNNPRVGKRLVYKTVEVWMPRNVRQLLRSPNQLTSNQLTVVKNWWRSGPYSDWEVDFDAIAQDGAVIEIDEQGYRVRAVIKRWEPWEVN